MNEGFEDINHKIDRLELLNEDSFPGNINMQIIDFN